MNKCRNIKFKLNLCRTSDRSIPNLNTTKSAALIMWLLSYNQPTRIWRGMGFIITSHHSSVTGDVVAKMDWCTPQAVFDELHAEFTGADGNP